MSSDLAALVDSHDIIELGMRADEVSRARHGARTTFVRVAVVSSQPGEPFRIPASAGEVRIEGTPVSRAAALIRVAEVAPVARDIPLSAYSLTDLEALAARESITLRSLLEELHAAGLELVAEASVDRLQSPLRAVEEVNIAGLSLARLTVYRTPAIGTAEFFSSVAELQREVAVIRAFAPLPRVTDPLVPSTGFDDVKRVALARIIVDNIPSIQVDWSLYGPKLAQVALTVGADDADAVSAEDDESPRRRSPLEEIRRNIRTAGRVPVERNGRFDLLPL